MVYTLPQRNAPEANLGNQIGQGMSQGFLSTAQPAIQKQYERGQLQQALNKLQSQSQNPNASPTDLLYNLIEASSYSPEIGRNLPQLYAELNKAREASAMQNVNYGGEGQGQDQMQPVGQGQQQMKPGGISAPSQQQNQQVQQAIQQSRNFPNNQKGQESPGNMPQEATSGQARPVLSGDQLLQKAQQRQQEFAKKGIIKPFEYFYDQVVNENEQNRHFNQNVENERIKRIQSQEKYGELAEQRLKKLIPDASDEEAAIFKKIGEEAAGGDKSQAEIDRNITTEVNKYKNSLTNIKDNLEAPRIQNKLQRSFLGKGADIKSVEQDARAAIRPLLEKGLYEKSRTMLANAGFYPEERETIIFGEMPKDLKQSVSSIPKARYSTTREHPLSLTRGFTPPTKEYDMKSRIDLLDNMSKIWGEGQNDKINLLQLRKEYEDKGYDWRVFKDAMNEMVNNGHIKLNDDQQNTLNSYLNNPPFSGLGFLLNKMGLMGR